MKKFFTIIVTALLFCMFSCSSKPKESASSEPPQVEVTKVEQKDVPIIQEWVGVLDGSVNAKIQSRVTGYLISQNYQEGSIVKKGDLLFEIDPRPFQVALLQAKANLAKSQANQSNLQLQEDRIRILFSQSVVSTQERDNSVQANAAAKADVEAQKAAVAEVELNLQYTKIISPVDGLAGIAVAEIGDLVTASSTTLTTVSTIDPIKSYISVSESEYLGAVQKLKELEATPEKERQAVVQLILSDGSVYPYKGRFDFANRQVDQRTGTILIAQLFPNPENILRPGQFAHIRIPVSVSKGALLVPQRAVNELQGNYQIAVVGPGNKAEIRPVKVGERVGGLWIIESGIKPGEQVIVEGFQKVHDGTVVTTKPWMGEASTVGTTPTLSH